MIAICSFYDFKKEYISGILIKRLFIINTYSFFEKQEYIIVFMGCLAINSFIDPILNYINTGKNIKKYFDFTYKSQKFQSRMLLELLAGC